MLRAGTYKNLAALAAELDPRVSPEFTDEALYLDLAYKAVRREFDALVSDVSSDNLRDKLRTVVGQAGLYVAHSMGVISSERRGVAREHVARVRGDRRAADPHA